jgi:hypothetical protein
LSTKLTERHLLKEFAAHGDKMESLRIDEVQLTNYQQHYRASSGRSVSPAQNLPTKQHKSQSVALMRAESERSAINLAATLTTDCKHRSRSAGMSANITFP